MKSFLLELFSVLSRLLNVITGGTADMTFSARSYRDDLWTADVIDWLALKIFGEEDHCAKWWLIEIQRSRRNITLAEATESSV
jgi:hypothetical protein